MKIVDPPSEEQLRMLRELYAAIKDELDTPELKYWCSEITLKRYLRARKYEVDKAIAMIRDTIAWRRERRPEHITFDKVSSEAEVGKMYCTWDVKDTKGRHLLIMRPRNQQSAASHDDQIAYFIYVMERASYLADKSNVSQMCWLLDFIGYSIRNAPAWRTSLETLKTLQNHYPERLGEGVCFHPPMIFTAFYKMIHPFIDPVTASKITFVQPKEVAEKMGARFNLDELEEAVGGRNPRAYDANLWRQKMMELEEEAWRDIRAHVVNISPSILSSTLNDSSHEASLAVTHLTLAEEDDDGGVTPSALADMLGNETTTDADAATDAVTPST